MRDIKDYTEKYIEEPFESTMVDIRKRMVIEQCGKYCHDNILEIGCGMSPFFLSYHNYKRMIIVEPGDMFVENSRLLAKNDDRISIIHGCMENQIANIASLGVSFDFIILSSLLHELDCPETMLKSIHAVAGQNTIIHINVPNAYSMHRLIAREIGLIDDVHKQSLQMKRMQRRRTYDMDNLVEVVETCGFEVLDSGSYFLKPFTHSQMQKCLDLGIIDDEVITGLERVADYFKGFGAGIYVNIRKKYA